jgi:hypothetical protein
MTSTIKDPEKGDMFKHVKSGALYVFVMIAKHSETMEELVIYGHFYSGKVWARPKAMFFDGRFEPFKS